MKNSDPVAVIILAAGLGKRMNSPLPKVMVEADGIPMIDFVVEAARTLAPERTVVVTGHQRELVEQHLSEKFPDPSLVCAVQETQRGTGDAARAALPQLENFRGSIAILCGDVPLLTAATLQSLLDIHHRERATVSLLSVRTLYPAQYGRILRGKNREILGIREFKDCSPEERLINEINSGIYVVDSSFLPAALQQLNSNNAQGEFYLTDIVAQAVQEGQTVSCLEHFDLSEVQGVNNRLDLAESSKLLRRRRVNSLIETGVLIDDPDSVEIDRQAQVHPGARIGSHTVIKGTSIIESGAVIDGFCVIRNTTIRQGAEVHSFSFTESADIGPDSSVGPFARLREGTVLKGDNKVGNFVEIKKSTLASGAKASHLTYLGDSTVGERANIGAGTITCNYDGKNKFATQIGSDAFIGSNTSLVAPVSIGDGATTGAGSVITKDVEAGALGVSRAEQRNVPGWAARKKTAKK